MARRTRVVDHRAGPVTHRARLGDREQALAARLDAAALALRADMRRRARLGAGAVAGRTGRAGRDRQRDLRAVHRLRERDRDLGLEIAAALLTRAPGAAGAATAAEEVVEDVAEAADVEAEPGALAGGPATTATHAEHGAAVVLLALLG